MFSKLASKFRFCCLILFIVICQINNGQWSDSITNQKNSAIFFNKGLNSNKTESEHFIPKDKEQSKVFYDSLAQIAGKKNWSKELYQLIVRSPESNIKSSNSNLNRINYFINYNNKIIRHIYIKQLDVFGPSIADTSINAEQWTEKIGNKIHVQTIKRVILNYLLIEEGERIDPYLLMDNERIIRSISSIQDARIYIIPVKYSTDSVDIQILTKDVMAYGLNWEVYDVLYGQASIWNSNIIGLGHHFGYTAYYNFNNEPKYGYSINYKIRNISNTFTSLELKHTNRKDLLSSELLASRKFITPSTKFGGGLGYSKVEKKFTLETIDSKIPDVTSNYESCDLWGGYSVPFKQLQMLKVRKNFFFAGRIQQFKFYERPEVSENYLYDFYNRRMYLTSCGIIWQGYHTARLVYDFGNTEDLPFGAMIKLTGGYEINEFYRRRYYGATISHSAYSIKSGYFSSTLNLGGFYRNKIEQGIIKFNFIHITPLFGPKRHQFRNFLNASYVQGINRFDDEFTIIEDRYGIRGFNNNLLRGNKNLYLKNEFVYYSPHYLYGFRFVYFAFVDGGMINHNNDYLFNNPIYLATGIGVRIRNERLIFNTIQLQVGFFPISPGIAGRNKQNVDLISYPQYRMPDFANRRPEIIEY